MLITLITFFCRDSFVIKYLLKYLIGPRDIKGAYVGQNEILVLRLLKARVSSYCLAVRVTTLKGLTGLKRFGSSCKGIRYFRLNWNLPKIFPIILGYNSQKNWYVYIGMFCIYKLVVCFVNNEASFKVQYIVHNFWEKSYEVHIFSRCAFFHSCTRKFNYFNTGPRYTLLVLR